MSTITFNYPFPGPDERDPRERGLDSARRLDPACQDGIRRQAEAIIDTVMESGPMIDRDRLAEFVEEFPGQPEVALAHFLREIRPSLTDYTDPAV